MSILIVMAVLAGCAATFASRPGQLTETPKQPKGEYVVVAGGCFWCLEPLFEMIKGVQDVEVGYAGGARPNDSYEQVCTGVTGHAESLKVWFDPKKVSRHDLLTLFMTMHDPTTKNRQGPDSGPQYRSTIFYKNEDQKAMAEQVIKEIGDAKIWKYKIVTTVEPLRNYTRAEEYHQDYFRKYESASPQEQAQMNVGYCRVIIEPKVQHFREKYKNLLKG